VSERDPAAATQATATTPAMREDLGDGLWSGRHRRLTTGLVLSVTLVAFETLAISTVMPIVARDLGGIELYGWVFSAFFLSSLVGIVVLGGLVDRMGPAIPFAIGMTFFAAGIALGGLAPSMEILVLARVLQGFGGGAIAPTSYAAIGRTLPDRLRPGMFAVLATAWVVPGLIGPAVAGAAGEAFGWRIVFLGLLPLIVVAAALAMPALLAIGRPEPDELGRRPTGGESMRRLPFAIAVAVGAGLVLAGLSSDALPLLVALTAIGLLIGIPALVRLEPPGTLLARRGMPAAILVRGLMTFAFFAVYAYIPFALVEIRGMNTAEAGLALTSATVAWTGGAWVTARLVDRFGEKWLIRVGFVLLCAGLLASLLVLTPAVPALLGVLTFGLAGFGIGIAYSPVSLIVLGLSPPSELGRATSGLQLADVLGEAIATGVTGAILAAAVRAAVAPTVPLGLAFTLGLAVGLLGLLVTVRLPARSTRTGTADADPVTDGATSTDPAADAPAAATAR
jgi:MFS family permease